MENMVMIVWVGCVLGKSAGVKNAVVGKKKREARGYK